MANLITGGLSAALMSADSSAKAALKPMNMVSRELRKREPDLELVERAGMYGGNELDKAGGALVKAREELKEAQKAARQEEKEKTEARLEEQAAEKAAQREAEKTPGQAAENVFTESTAAEYVQSARKLAPAETAGEDAQAVRRDPNMAESSGETAQAARERIRTGLSARQNYLTAAFQHKVSRARMDLRG